MKRISIFLAVLFLSLALLVSCQSFSDTEYAVISEGNISADGFIYDKYENSTVRITGIENMPAELHIPSQIDGMKVVEICDYAFAEQSMLLYLKFPAEQMTLGKNIFSNCVGLVAADLSGSMTSLPMGIFEGCKNLVLLDGTDNVTEISDRALADCAALPSVSFGSLTSVGSEAFRGCRSLAKISLPETLTHLGDSAFWGCDSLISAEINGSVVIQTYAFLDCTSLTNVIFGDSVSEIGEEAFRGCTSLYRVEFGKKTEKIGSYAFHGCDAIAEVIFAADRASVTVGDGNEALNAGGAK